MLGVREELFHPMVAHFPIVMFCLALVTKFLELTLKNYKEEMCTLSKFLMYTAPGFFLITMFLGDFSLDIIKPNFCELTKVYDHEDHAYWSLYFFLPAIAAQVGVGIVKEKFRLITNIGVLLFLLGGNFFMFKTAHSGGELVYDYGAAVKNSKQSCK